MGLGLFLGALAIGACALSAASESHNKTNTRYAEQERYYIIDHRPAVSQQVKVDFYDNYRAVDNYLARLIGEGSGGVGLLILTCRYQKVNNSQLNNIIKDLQDIRDYRNNLSHNKNKWSQIPDPKSYYNSVLSRVTNIVNNDRNHIAQMMYKEASFLKQKRQNQW